MLGTEGVRQADIYHKRNIRMIPKAHSLIQLRNTIEPVKQRTRKSRIFWESKSVIARKSIHELMKTGHEKRLGTSSTN